MKAKLNLRGTGNGARDGVTFTSDKGKGLRDALAVCRARRVAEREQPANACAARLVDHLWQLADAFARSFQRKWQATGARPFDSFPCNPLDEITAIYREHFIAAFVRCGLMPANKRELYRASGNALPFRALLAWHREYKRAARQVRSYLWGHGAELCNIEPLATPWQIGQAARHLAGGNPSAVAWDNSDEPEADAWEALAGSRKLTSDNVAALGSVHTYANSAAAAPIESARVRRELRHARWTLRAFWTVSASRKWRAGYVADSALLRVAATVARGYGTADLSRLGLLGERTTATGGALRVAVHRLRGRIAAGDKLLTDQPARVASAFVDCFGDSPRVRRLVADLMPV